MINLKWLKVDEEVDYDEELGNKCLEEFDVSATEEDGGIGEDIDDTDAEG